MRQNKRVAKLSEVAQIQVGYQPRDNAPSISAIEGGTHRIIQVKDLGGGSEVPFLSLRNLFSITPGGDAGRYQVSRGDVLFLARGSKPAAAAVAEPLQATIAAYYFYIVRADRKRVLPEFLTWFINQPSARAYFESRQLGSASKMIPREALENTEIPLPSLAVQRSIVELEKLRQAEESALTRLAKARKRLIDGVALRAAEGSTGDNHGE